MNRPKKTKSIYSKSNDTEYTPSTLHTVRVPSTRFPENSGTWDTNWLVTETSSCWFIVSTFVSFCRGTFRLEEDPPFVSLSHTPPWEYAGTPSKSAKENCLREGKTIGSSEMHHWMVSTLPMAFLRDGIVDMVCLRDGKTSFWNHLFFVVQWRTVPNRRKPMKTVPCIHHPNSVAEIHTRLGNKKTVQLYSNPKCTPKNERFLAYKWPPWTPTIQKFLNESQILLGRTSDPMCPAESSPGSAIESPCLW